MNGKNQRTAKSELLIKLKKVISDALSNSNRPQSAMFMLKRNPNRVSQIPLLVGWVLMNLNIKIGAIKIAISIDGTNLLILVDMNMPNPRTNKIPGKYLCFVILDLINHFIKRSISIVVQRMLVISI